MIFRFFYYTQSKKRTPKSLKPETQTDQKLMLKAVSFLLYTKNYAANKASDLGLRALLFARIFCNVSNTISTSASVVYFPKLNRIAELARSRLSFIARKTWLGSTLPELHAEPLLTATPCKSKLMTIAKLSIPGKERLTTPGKRSFT